MNAINQLLSNLKLEANVHHNGQYCGDWALDTSGTRRMTFHVVSRGRCFLEFQGEVIELNEGDAVFLPCDSKHCVSNLPNSGMILNQTASIPMTQAAEQESTGLVCGNFAHSHPVFDKLVKQMPKLIIIRKNESKDAGQIIDLMLQESRSSDEHSNVLLNRLADCLFYILVRNNLNVNSGVFAAFVHPNLSAVMDLIHRNSDQRLTLDNMAEAAGLSRSALSSTFKDVVGQTPMEYLTQWRMTQAYRWLADEGITTLDAALRCGYETEASFAKAFKRVIGQGPGSVRALRAG